MAEALSGAHREDADLNKSQKFVRILEALQEPGGANAYDLMARFGLDDRTMRRYISDLRGLGLPLESEGRGSDRRLWMAASYRRQRVQVSLLEMISLKFGRSAFRFLEGTGFAEDMDDALEAFTTLGGAAVATAGDIERKFIAVPEHRKDHTRDADLIDEVLSAVVYQNPSTAFYAKVGGTTRRYSLEPLTLAIYKQGLYLFARDTEAEGLIKTFAIDRFRSFKRSRGVHFEYPDDYNPSQLFTNAFGIIGGTPQSVSLRFHRRVAPYIQERIWHPSQDVSRLDDGSVRLTMSVGVAAELVSWVLSFGPDVYVEAPDSLSERIRRLHAEAARGADPSKWGRR
ncbi:MAG: hypothetical protein CL927_04735 [Deltaproteobacteria bacterium]|nr:hypothetical protein [Deltaproteobacteria bacterium]